MWVKLGWQAICRHRKNFQLPFTTMAQPSLPQIGLNLLLLGNKIMDLEGGGFVAFGCRDGICS
jgi:hypothetical protein